MRLSQSIVLLLLPLKVMACGLDWSEPISHFENVDYQGNVHIVRKLGEVEKLPIYLIFNSSYGNSPYAGSGFEIPLLESRMWQVDENRFQMKTPSGWLWIFQRTKVPNVLEGNAGWKGLIKDDTITVWAPCGDKITFKNGKIVSMQLKDEKFDYAYKGTRVESLQMNGRTILEVKNDDKTGEVTGLDMPSANELIGFEPNGNRPRTETIGGATVVGRVCQTLGAVIMQDGSKEIFEFGVDEKMNQTIYLKNRKITWNSTTTKMLNDGEWNYDISVGDDCFANSSIKRFNKLGQMELWHYDGSHGKETTVALDGTERVRSWFMSGVLTGKTRKILQRNSLGSKELYSASYGENGNLLREKRDDLEVEYSCTGKILRILKGGYLYWIAKYDGRDQIIEEQYGDTTKIVYSSAKISVFDINPDHADEKINKNNNRLKTYEK